MRSVAIIGGGVAGVVTLRHFKAAGLDVELWEQSPSLGGIWVFAKEGASVDHPAARAYASLTTNSSKAAVSLSDFSLETDNLFPTREEMQKYYTAYTSHHDLASLIHKSCGVTNVTQIENNRWKLDFCDGTSREFDAVVCATGTYNLPDNAALQPWLSQYTGPVIHSAHFRHPETFAGKNVVIIGIGGSALDISFDLSFHCPSVTVCSSGASILSCFDEEKALPTDYEILSNGFGSLSPSEQANRLRELSADLTSKFISRGMPYPKTGRLSVLKKEKHYLNQIDNQIIKLKPNVSSVEGNTLIFPDGSRVVADAIVTCTGYRIQFPFLKDAPFSPKPFFKNKRDGYHQDYLELYKYCIDPSRPSLMFVGIFDTLGNTGVLAEMQARWLAAICAGRIEVPGIEERVRWTNEKKMEDLARGGTAPMFRDYVSTMLMYAGELGLQLPESWPNHFPVIGPLFCKENWNKTNLELLESKLAFCSNSEF